jgi:multidrug efflux pump subunit AcrB
MWRYLIVKWLSFLLERKLIVGLSVVFILLLGMYSVNKLDIEMFPKVNFDGATVYVVAGDSSTGDMENKITNVLERRISSIDSVESYTSNTSIGNVSITITFERGKGPEAFAELDPLKYCFIFKTQGFKITRHRFYFFDIL